MYTTAAVLASANQFSIGNQTASEMRPPQVEDQVNAIEINAKDLAQIVSQLEGKLVSVTQPRLDPPNQKSPIPEPVLVPLANKLRDISTDVRGSVDRLRQLCGTIELCS